jgi:hypothetical protein
MNVIPRCPRARANSDGLYLATVRGETRYPSLANSPLIMSSPQVALSRHIRRMRWRRSTSMGGRPRGDAIASARAVANRRDASG